MTYHAPVINVTLGCDIDHSLAFTLVSDGTEAKPFPKIGLKQGYPHRRTEARLPPSCAGAHSEGHNEGIYPQNPRRFGNPAGRSVCFDTRHGQRLPGPGVFRSGSTHREGCGSCHRAGRSCAGRCLNKRTGNGLPLPGPRRNACGCYAVETLTTVKAVFSSTQ